MPIGTQTIKVSAPASREGWFGRIGEDEFGA